MSGPIRGSKPPGIPPQIDSTTSEKTSKSKSAETVKSYEPSKTDTAEKFKRASQDLASSRKMDQQLQTISQKMNILKDLSPDQKKLLETAKKDKATPDLSSLPIDKGNIDPDILKETTERPGLGDLPGVPKDRLNPFDSSGVQDYFSEEQGPPWTEEGPSWGESPSWTEITD